MACTIDIIARFDDVTSVFKHLGLFRRFRKFREDAESSDEDQDAWLYDGMASDNQPASNTEELTLTWLQDCLVSMSSTMELLVIAHKISMVILTSKWNFHEEGAVKTKYNVTWHGNPCQGESEQITSLLCLPLLSQGISSQCGRDWTCIVVGFSSGSIRFYTEDCRLLLDEKLHNEGVLQLKCQSCQPGVPGYLPEPIEELYVTYATAVCIIPGFGLFQTLRACRNQLAIVQARGGPNVFAPPLAYKKLGLPEQTSVMDCEVAGPSTANTFDHLETASVCGGFNTWYRSSAPQTSLVVAAGSKPFVGFHYALEGGAPLVLTDVAKVMANRIKSAIGQVVPNWLLGGKKGHPAEQSAEVAMEPAEPMGCRFGLCDSWRHGTQIVLSPHRTHCVVCDKLGRVTLIDTQEGTALRMWKGYRDAQCGWMEVPEDVSFHKSKAKPRIALFLVIYAPKKGIIEVWTIQNGSKIASFPVIKTGRLLYTNYGMMGLNNNHLKDGNKCQYPCVFINPTGSISEINVPFHFSLNKNSKHARDLHVMKKLKCFLKEQKFDSDHTNLCEEVCVAFEQLKTADVQTAALEALSASRVITVAAMQAALQVITLQEDPSSGPEEPAVKTLTTLSSCLQCLVTLFTRLTILNREPPCHNSTLGEQQIPEMLTTQLNTSPEEVTRLVNLFSTLEMVTGKSKTKTGGKVTFGENISPTLADFISAFELCSQDIHLKTAAGEERLQYVGGVILQGALNGADIEEWSAAIKSSCIAPMDLVKLAVHYWLIRAHTRNLNNHVADMLRLTELLKVLCEIAGRERVCVNSNQESPWWQKVRTILMRSSNAWAALSAAVVCRSVALSVEREGAAADDWEHVSFDTCQWGVLIGRLEDVAILEAIVNHYPPGFGSYRKHLSLQKPVVSVEALLERGKGGVAEIVAVWLTTWVHDPYLLVSSKPEDKEKQKSENKEKQKSEDMEKQMPEDEEKQKSEDEEKQNSKKGGVQEGEAKPPKKGRGAFKLSGSSDNDKLLLSNLSSVGILREHFPYSMSDSILMTNICWEFMYKWRNESITDMTLLGSAIDCLVNIPSTHIRQGLCSMLWTMFIRVPLQETTKYIQLEGRAPKVQLIFSMFDSPDTAMTPFLRHCLLFFDVFLEVCSNEDETVAPAMKICEELWDVGSSGQLPLVELALTQPQANFDLLHLHYQLVLMLHMMATFHMKLARPLNTLLDAAGQAALFTDLTGRPRLPSRHPDTPLVIARTHFLCRVISSAVQTIETVDAYLKTFDTSHAIHWMTCCLTLASYWSVSSDILRRHQICELYSNGFDRLAEEVIPIINDTSLLASQLLLIVGQRMRYIVNQSPNLCNQITKLSAALSTWLETLPENNLRNMNTSLDDMSLLLIPVMQYLSEQHQEYELALNMVDAVHAFKDAAS